MQYQVEILNGFLGSWRGNWWSVFKCQENSNADMKNRSILALILFTIQLHMFLIVLEKYHYYLFPLTSEEDSWGTKALDLTLSRNLASPYLDSTRKVKKAKAELMMYPPSFIFHFQRGSPPYFITNKLFMRSACKRIRYEETKKADRVGLKK